MAKLTKRQAAARRRLKSVVKITHKDRPSATVVEVYRAKPSRGGDWRWRGKAGNHEIIAQGEGYSRKWSAARGAQRVFPSAELRFANTAPASA